MGNGSGGRCAYSRPVPRKNWRRDIRGRAVISLARVTSPQRWLIGRCGRRLRRPHRSRDTRRSPVLGRRLLGVQSPQVLDFFAMSPTLVACLLLVVVGLASATCPDNPAIDHLDVERFTGMWNVIKESDNQLMGTSRNVKCKHNILSIVRPEIGYDVQANIVSYNSTSRNYNETRLGLRKLKANHQDGKYEIFVNGFHGFAGRFFVVGTDYDNYAVVWLCYTGIENGDDVEYNAILSRKKSLNEQYLSEAKKLLPRRSYRSVDQTSCPEYKSSQP